MMQNTPYVEEVELDEDEVDPADITPLVSGDSPIVTVPVSEDENVVEVWERMVMRMMTCRISWRRGEA